MAVQSEVEAAFDDSDAIGRNLRHAVSLIETAANSVRMSSAGSPPKIAVLPEAFLSGFGAVEQRSYKQNYGMAIEIPGPETEVLGRVARKEGLYIAAAAFERDSRYEGHFFNTGFLLDPEGDVVLKYRKQMVGHGIELSSAPADVLRDYGVSPKEHFPVLDTPLGRLAIFICNDRRFPEISRSLALQGAEVLLHPTGAGGGVAGSLKLLKQWRNVTQVRAYENNVYLVGAQWAHSPHSELLTSVGHSLIVDFRGDIVAEIGGTQRDFIHSLLDIEALRRQRAELGFLINLPTPIFAEVYGQAQMWPTDEHGFTTADEMPQNLTERRAARRSVYAKRVTEGVFVPPDKWALEK